MSLLIYVAHTGLRLLAEQSFDSLEDLREWIAQKTSIAASRQILMTVRGKLVKQQTFHAEKEIFVYDRDLFSAPNGPRQVAASQIEPPEPLDIQNPPDTLSDEGSLEAWQALFRERRYWASELSKNVEDVVEDIAYYDNQLSDIQRATAIAAERVKQNSSGLRESLGEAKKWANGIVEEPISILQDWNNTLRRLSSLKTRPELLRFFQVPEGSTKQFRGKAKESTLHDVVDKETANQAASRGKQAIKWLEQQLSEIELSYEELGKDTASLVEQVSDDFSSLGGDLQNSIDGLSEEMHTILNKINSDCERVLGATNNSRVIATVSKTALHHTRSLLPSLIETARDAFQLLSKTVERRNKSERVALECMQKVSTVESSFASLKASISGLEIGDDDDRNALDTLNYIQQLPSVYSSVLVECVRRSEWSQKMMTDSSTLAEEMAVHKDDEERRRKKWFKSVENHLDHLALEGKPLAMEVNLKNQGEAWPKLSRDDIDAFVTLLQAAGGFQGIVRQINEDSRTLDAPSKQQIRRQNVFKNGSIHEAAFGRNSLLLRGDEDLLQSLQSDKSRLEDRLKGSESRVRKLEDLLHRQSQVHRPPSAHSPRPSMDRHATSPVLNHVSMASPKGNDLGMRRPSVASRRESSNMSADDKAYAQTIVRLEADLHIERTKAVQAQEVIANHVKAHDELKTQAQEAVSTKKDLMDNFEAQQVEFDGERRLFGDENRKLKLRLEELEEELDRLLGSHDNARAGIDDRTQALETEIIQVRQDASEEVQRIQGQIEFLKSDYNEQREKAYTLERQNQILDEENINFAKKVEELESQAKIQQEERLGQRESLKAIHNQFAEDAAAPEDFGSLVEAVEVLSLKAAGYLQDITLALEHARANSTLLENKSKHQEDTVTHLNKIVNDAQAEKDTLQKAVTGEKLRFSALKGELEDEREELSRLRAKYTEGETGSETLRSRIASEEKKAEKLSLQLASMQAHSEQLENMLADKTKEMDTLEISRKSTENVFHERAQRAEEVSLQLFSQTDRLTHLLEYIGFTVSRQDDAMVIQRVPRNTIGSSTVTDPSQSMNRSLSTPTPLRTTNTPPNYLHWALADNGDLEHKYFELFIRESQAFDMDAFSEAIVKRVKDTEHIARKWQREAKSYREKTHRAQFESHNKIAFRSFREGDLALFLPTRNQAPKRSWAAFNVGAPHYFLREQEFHRLKSRDWLLARISRIEERVVDLSKGGSSNAPLTGRPVSASDDGVSTDDDDNPFGLSDGLRWYFLDATEEKLGAPSTPGLGKTTVASANVDAAGSIQHKKQPDDGAVSRTLAKSLDSRRSSGNSRKSLLGAAATLVPGGGTSSSPEAGSSHLRPPEDHHHQHPSSTAIEADENGSGNENGNESGGNGNGAHDAREDGYDGSIPPAAKASLSSLALSAGKTVRPSSSSAMSKAWESLWSLDGHVEGRKGGERGK